MSVPHPSRPTRTLRRAATVALTAALAATLSGCGAMLGPGTTADGDPMPTVQDLYAKTREATLAAKSGHVTGFVTDEGESMTVDLEGRTNGANQRVRITTDDGRATMLSVKGRLYISADWDFWASSTADPRAGDVFKNKQVLVPPKQARKFPSEMTLGTLLDEAFKDASVSPVARFVSDVGLRTENDREVWVVKDRDIELWSDRKTDRLVKLVYTGDDPFELTFDKWDAARTFKAPRPSAVYR
ncbi:hypothetical protein [Phycicoccus flavus]|uniref:Lipoprotein LprG n=1 Tax=Phycicoccus flavus TaxID=2502783 RepID=A0A8T6R1I9_9MICO|nr:hypothetical protein [Phycicoccus flavus]NHA67602.1 hypothetical protein [Phycicoccus flavus]